MSLDQTNRFARGLLMVGVLTALFVPAGCGKDELPPREEESASEKYGQASQAFGGGAPRSADAHTTAVDGVVRAFERAVTARDARALTALFDVERLVAELVRLPGFPSMSRSEQSKLVEIMSSQLPGMASREIVPNLQGTFSTMAVRPGERSDELAAFVRIRDADGYSIKMRWWLVESDGHWRLYDFEDLDVGLRFSTMAVLGGAAAVEGREQWIGQVQSLFTAVRTMQTGDFDAVQRTLDRLRHVSFPDDIDAVRWMTQGFVHMANDSLQAVPCLDRALELNPELVAALTARAMAHNLQEDYASAIKDVDAYEAMLGADVTTHETRGNALLGLERFDEAALAFFAGLDDWPHSAECIIGLGLALPEDRYDELAARFRQMSVTGDQFDYIKEELQYAGADQALSVLTDVMNEN